MKLDRQKLYNALTYINEINSSKFLAMDFSDLFDNKKDLTPKEKAELFWVYEKLTNLEIIQKMLDQRANNNLPHTHKIN